MRSYPRIRKTVKWGGLVVTTALGVLWLASAWMAMGYSQSFTRWCALFEGRFEINAGAPRLPLRLIRDIYGRDSLFGSGGFWLDLRQSNGTLRLRFETWTGAEGWFLAIPLWSLFLPAALIADIAWRLDLLARRRERAGKCPKCGYDRAGLAAGAVCPECAATPVAAAPAAK